MLILEVRGERLYACSKCGAIYETPSLARDCERSCGRGACDMRITSRAVGWIRKPLGRLK